LAKQQDKIIVKFGDVIITRYPDDPRRVVVTTDFREAKASTVEIILKEWVEENWEKKDVSEINLKDFIHTIVMENRLWVSSDFQKEMDSLYKKIVSKKSETLYEVDFIVKNMAQHYRAIYKRKNV
jgi:hypothetical protein